MRIAVTNRGGFRVEFVVGSGCGGPPEAGDRIARRAGYFDGLIDVVAQDRMRPDFHEDIESVLEQTLDRGAELYRLSDIAPPVAAVEHRARHRAPLPRGGKTNRRIARTHFGQGATQRLLVRI